VLELIKVPPGLGPSWARGFAVDGLKEVAQLFKSFDAPFVHGAFGHAKENSIAEWLSTGSLFVTANAAIVCGPVKTGSAVLDFAGRQIGRAQAGDYKVRRIAARPGHAGELVPLYHEALRAHAYWNVRARLWCEIWQESATSRVFAEALGLRWLGSKIRASSEIVGIWGAVGGDTPIYEQGALVRLKLPPLPVAPLLAALDRDHTGWADHYSSYNKRKSWSARTLRGYGGREDFIIKPAEMARAWKTAHRAEMLWKIEDTPLRPLLPEAEPLIAAIPGVKHRIRLMRLAPGGGELTRHADITDPDAGTAYGRLMRIHIPLRTNPSVMFREWLLDGRTIRVHMQAGEAWYLDTRKPHTAKNGGDTERIHLVMDVASSPQLLDLLDLNTMHRDAAYE
jgi:hypothetical protein